MGIVAFSWVISLYTSIRQWRRMFLHLSSKLTGCFWKIKEQGNGIPNFSCSYCFKEFHLSSTGALLDSGNTGVRVSCIL